MKKKMIVVGVCLLICGCGPNPLWKPSGSDAQAKELELAEEYCGCIYELLDDHPEVNASLVGEQMPAYARLMEGEKVSEEEVAEISKVISLELYDSPLIDSSECFREVYDKIFNRGVSPEKMDNQMFEHCPASGLILR